KAVCLFGFERSGLNKDAQTLTVTGDVSTRNDVLEPLFYDSDFVFSYQIGLGKEYKVCRIQLLLHDVSNPALIRLCPYGLYVCTDDDRIQFESRQMWPLSNVVGVSDSTNFNYHMFGPRFA